VATQKCRHCAFHRAPRTSLDILDVACGSMVCVNSKLYFGNGVGRAKPTSRFPMFALFIFIYLLTDHKSPGEKIGVLFCLFIL